MGNSKGIARPDGIERVSNGILTGLVAVVLICAVLPVIVSQLAGLSSNTVLATWSGLAAFQTLAYIIPTVFLIGAVIVMIRYFSSSRE